MRHPEKSSSIYEKVLSKLPPRDQVYMDSNTGVMHDAFMALCQVIEEEVKRTQFLNDKDMEL